MGSWMGVSEGWMWLLALIWMPIVVVPVALVYLFLWSSSSDGSDGALAILREEYACSELSDEEYECGRNRLLQP